jgi:hypothetical protein
MLIIDLSLIPENFANCKTIEFSPADPEIVRDYLRLITLSQSHIIDPRLLERVYLTNKRDLRQTITQVQFWCQFGVGDSRGGAEWLNWGGIESDWVISRGTYLDGVEWRQKVAAGEQIVLEMVEEAFPDLDIENLIFPQDFQNQHTVSPTSTFKRQKAAFSALKGITDFLDTMSFLDYTIDQQFTAYEVAPFLKPSSDDILSDPVLRSHPGRRFEKPQGVETSWAPSIRIIARRVLQEKLQGEGYYIPPLSSERITSQHLKDILHPRPYQILFSCTDR